MKKGLHLTLLLFLLNVLNLNSQVVLNELSFGGFFGDFVELKNLGPDAVDVSGYFLFTTQPDNIPSSVSLSSLNLGCGSLVMQPGDIIVFDDVSDFISWAPDLGDVALYSTDLNNFEVPDDLVDYVAWGLAPSNTFTEGIAVDAGQWTSGDFADGNYNGLSIEYDGTGDASSDWPFNNMPTICMENASVGVSCDAEGGTPNITQFEFCVGDGNADIPTGLSVSGNVGSLSQWIITDVTGNIMDLPATVDDANFDGAGEGLCIMWHLSYEDNITGLQIGGTLTGLGGCHDESEPVLIVRSEVNGGELTGGPFEFCVGDAVPDFVSDISLTGNIGGNTQWVVTDDQGEILGLPADPSQVDFDIAPAGTCLIWNLSYNGAIAGLDVGANAADLIGCFELSNSVTVNRFGPTAPECGGGGGGSTDYVLIGFEDLRLERATVYSGGLGVMKESGDLEITEDSDVTADGTFVKGPYVRIYDGAKANNICAVVAEPVLPDFIYNNTNTDDDQDVDVDNNEIIVLTESVYEDIDIDDGATVTFSGQEFVFIEELDIEDNVTILFDQCTNLIIKKRLSVGKYNNFNPGEENVFLFVEEEAEVKKGTYFYGGIFTMEELRIRKADEDAPTELHGIFIGEDVKARDYVGLWYENVIPCQPNITGSDPYAATQQEEHDEAVEELLESAALVLFPNPAKETAYLKVLTETTQEATIQVFNLTNQLVLELPNQLLSEQAISIHVADLAVGMYTARVTLEDGTTLSQKLMVTK